MITKLSPTETWKNTINGIGEWLSVLDKNGVNQVEGVRQYVRDNMLRFMIARNNGDICELDCDPATVFDNLNKELIRLQATKIV